MKFLIDRCAGSRIAEWLSSLGHDVIETRSLCKKMIKQQKRHPPEPILNAFTRVL